jgi:hypothetical protein
MTAEEIGKIVEDAAKALGEHFEAVQILASNSDGEGSRCIKRGAGNFYARLAMAREMLQEDEARDWENATKDDGDDD